MELKLTRTVETSEDKQQPILEVVLKADDDEKDIFRKLGLSKLADTDELLQKYFSYHRDLYSAMGIPTHHWDDLHGGDNQFSGTCKGFALFLARLSDKQLDKLSTVILGRIRSELENTNATLTSIRTIMLSPTKRLPTTSFPIEDSHMRLQVGNKIYGLNPVLENDNGEIIEEIRGSIKETIDKHRDFYQKSNQELIDVIQREYKSEIERVKQQYANRALFPLWLTQRSAYDYKITTYAERDKIAFVIPFNYHLAFIKMGNNVYRLKEEYQESRDCFLIIFLLNEKYGGARLVQKDFTICPNMHTLSNHLCLGNYRSPKDPIQSSEGLIKIRNDIQKVLQTTDLNSLGRTDYWNDLHFKILNARDNNDLEKVAYTDEPAYIHHSEDS